MGETEVVLNDRYKIIQTVHKGSFGVVYKAQDTRGDIPVAIKELDLSGLEPGELKELQNTLKKEVNDLKYIKHPNLVRFIDSFTLEERFFYVTEWVEGISLKDAVQKMGHPFRGKDVINLFYTMANFIEFLHSRKNPYCLRILKPSDIMITTDGTAKIVDLSISAEFQPEKLSPGYAIPKERPGTARDVFILGELIFELVTARPPGKFLKKGFPESKELNKDVTKALSEIISKCLEDRTKRFKTIRLLKREIIIWFPEYTKKEFLGEKEDAKTKELSITKSKVACTGCVLVLVAIVAVLVLYLPGLLNKWHTQKLEECGDNVKKLSKAINKYHDNNGYYPEKLDDLVPKYLDMIKVCPEAKTREVYVESYKYNDINKYFEIYCRGHHHKDAGVPENYPKYTKIKGFVLKPKDKK
ncbi:MAG: serine/threonine protein kinase [Candidatus Eremiobacteraeota bacterium]|nr:serine/threonine protein kinase [Candidatus Eremiobacteraeota bacterium]